MSLFPGPAGRVDPSQAISDVSARPRRSQWHWLLLGCFYGLAVLWGIRSAYAWQPTPLALLLPLAMCTILCTWTVSDSLARGHPIPLLARAWFFIAAGIAVPGYILWTRGWAGLVKLVLHSIAWYSLCLVALLIARIVLLGRI